MKNFIKRTIDRIRRKHLLVKPVANNRFTLNEIGDKCQNWLEEEIAKDPFDRFTDIEKYWMHEAYVAGFNEAIKNCG